MKEIVGVNQPGMQLADLHIHTTGSDGHMTPEQVVELAQSLEHLSAIAITDHNTIRSGYEAKNYAAKQGYPLIVYVGSEINTQEGHFIGLDLAYDIAKGQPVVDTIKQIHQQNGLAIVVHPFLPRLLYGKFSLDEADIALIRDHPDPEVYLDAYEAYNSGVEENVKLDGNDKAIDYYERNYITGTLGAAVGGTDAHFFTVGRAVTAYSGDLLEAIRERRTAVLALNREEQLAVWEKAKIIFGENVIFSDPRISKMVDRVLGNP